LAPLTLREAYRHIVDISAQSPAVTGIELLLLEEPVLELRVHSAGVGTPPSHPHGTSSALDNPGPGTQRWCQTRTTSSIDEQCFSSDPGQRGMGLTHITCASAASACRNQKVIPMDR
jgi:hypothetical protein